MTARLFDLRWIALAFALALVMVGITMYDNVQPGQAWFSPGIDPYYPESDCGKNYSLKLQFTLPNGAQCEHARGMANEPYVRRIQKSFEGEGNSFTTTLDLALQYIENVVWRIVY